MARAHAKTGGASAITGYLGMSDVFDRSLARFAHHNASQTEQDHSVLLNAVKFGRVPVTPFGSTEFGRTNPSSPLD